MTSGYIGFDPSADSLHIGNLAAIMLLKRLQLAGHRPYVILGGATGMVGDPSFKAQERSLLSRDTLVHNQQSIEKQLRKFLDFTGENGAVVLNNYDWFKEMGFLSFLREVGKHISVNYMMAKESVKNRLKTGISYTEFAYQLLQGYDFCHLYTHHNVKLQMGGSDQWGNITTGIELIRRRENGVGYALTTPLITKRDGTKFGKTEKGNIWLDRRLTTPFAFYQFWLNCEDQLAALLVKRMTLMGREAIEKLLKTHEKAPHKRTLQRRLAWEMTMLVHSEQDASQVKEASEILFGNEPAERLKALEEQTLLESLAGVPHITITQEAWDTATSLVNLLSDSTGKRVFSSRRIAREIIGGGGLRINKERVKDVGTLPKPEWLHGKYLLIQRGKKHFYLLEKRY